MYVCVCKGITDRQVKAAIDDGAHSIKALRETLGITSQCGKCAVMTREILDSSLSLEDRGVFLNLAYQVA